MDFRIADTFTASMARLNNDEQKLVKTTAFDLQMNPAHPGLKFHRIERAKDKHFWSARVGSDIRLILHKTAASLLLCYVDHHDAAYTWAERRKIERHPVTGAAQLIEIRERVQDVIVPRYVDAIQPAAEPALKPAVAKPKKPPLLPPLFATMSDEQLLGYGVPPNGSPTPGWRPKRRCSSSRRTCRRRPAKRCSIWLPGSSRRFRRPPRPPIRSTTRPPSSGSG